MLMDPSMIYWILKTAQHPDNGHGRTSKQQCELSGQTDLVLKFWYLISSVITLSD